MTTTRELTTPDSWDSMWANWCPPAESSSLRRNMRMQRETDTLLTDLLSKANPSASVLELGCAPGAMLALLHSLRPDLKYRGIDYAPLGIEVARKQLASLGIDADLTVADIKTASPQQADLVMSFGLIEHFDDPIEILGHHRRYTAPGGYTAVTVPNYAHPILKSMLAKFSPETLETHNLKIMSTDAIRQSFSAAGFVNVEVGYAGPASIPSSRVKRNAAGRAFGKAARAWNLATEVMPSGWPWSTHVWGIGRAPR